MCCEMDPKTEGAIKVKTDLAKLVVLSKLKSDSVTLLLKLDGLIILDALKLKLQIFPLS